MKKSISIFQIVVFALCGVGVLLAVLIFSDKLPIGKSGEQELSGSITMWGTLPYAAVRAAIEPMVKTYPNVRVDYVQKDPSVMRTQLVNELAAGRGPDLITLAPSDVIANRDLVLPIPYTSVPQAAYLESFAAGATSFMTGQGIVAFPMTIDPLVMYYNRDLLTSAFTLNPPATWGEVVTLNAAVTKKTDAGLLSVGTAALGTFDNIRHAKEIISTLILQTGNKLVVYDEQQQWYRSTFSEGVGVPEALGFYTRFANPANPAYSWSAALPSDRDQFIAGKLALYFGYSSEMADIRLRNPNLNFDIAMMPQNAAASTKSTYGSMVGVAVLKRTQNPQLAVTVAQQLVSSAGMTAYLANDPTVAPARRDLLGASNDDARREIIRRSAIIAQSWLDPDPVQTTALFRKYVGDINAGIATPQTIITPGNALFNSILSKAKPAKPSAAGAN